MPSSLYLFHRVFVLRLATYGYKDRRMIDALQPLTSAPNEFPSIITPNVHLEGYIAK